MRYTIAAWYDHIKAYVGADNYNKFYTKLITMDDSVVV